MLSIFERYKKAIGRIAKPVKSRDARSTDVKLPFGNDASVTHGKFFGENIARAKDALKESPLVEESRLWNEAIAEGYPINGLPEIRYVNLVPDANGGFTATFSDISNMSAQGETEKEAIDNLYELYEAVIKNEGS